MAAFTATAASASSPEPSPSAFAALARTCTADGAFGLHFGQKNVALAGWAGIAPFAVDAWSEGRDGLYQITAAASFAKAPMSQEDRVALAAWVLRKLDSDIAATHRFSRRDPRRDGVRFSTATLALDLSQSGTTVRMTCTDLARKNAAREELRRQT